MQNNKLQKIFFKTFLVTVVCIVLVAGIGIAAYKVISNLFGDDGTEKSGGSVQTLNIITDVTLGTPSIELIYDADENDSVIKHMIIAIFNTETHNLDYVTVPVNTEVTLSDELYQELLIASETLPQTFKLSEITNYFNGKEAYEYGELIMEDVFGVKMSYYTKITSSQFENYFTESEMKYYQPVEAAFSDTLIYSNTFISSFANLKAENVINFLTDYSNATTSNLSLTSRTNYADEYALVDYTKIYYWHLFGDYADAGEKFTPNMDANTTLFETILSNAAYTVTQSEYNENMSAKPVADSKDLKIEILNGGGIKKLAAKWKSKLTSEGYNIGDVGDYSDDTLTSSKIISKDESVGLDLLKYFKNAKIEVGDVPDGYDILIVVGAEDNFDE